ncbi:MAG TPA: rhomboid family intramembrane serine protease [Steroidobacteraceae bacterium]|nr:rhomboid family intramembrane serine protease [Steroidobacteraceae bacterium]
MKKNPAVLILIALNVAVYLIEGPPGDRFEQLFALWPLSMPGAFHWWQIVSYAFLHDPTGLAHITFNMIGLLTFGMAIERSVGSLRLLACYFASVVSAALAQLIVPPLLGAEPGPVIGASGGVFGLLLAFAVMFPHQKVVMLLLPIPLPAWLFACLYAAAELFFGVTGTLSGIAHFAHLGGMIGSALVVLQWRHARLWR